MAVRSDHYPYQRRLGEFDAQLQHAQATIIAQIEAAIRSGDLRSAMGRRLQLAAVTATLDQLGATINPIAVSLVREAYEQAADRAADQIAVLSVDAPEIPGAFSGVSREAIEAMQHSLTMRLDDARQTLGRRVEDIYAREQRQATVRALLGVEGSPQAASQELQQRLLRDRAIAKATQDGNVGFVDRAGKRWSLDTYANMATRTVTREAVVQGAIARMASHGIALARVSRHGSSCEICKPHEGTLVSLDGSVSEYRGEAVADISEAPPLHPNCEHSLEPVSATINSLREELAGAVA